jgi:IclR family KDG regulon transcriptional repressor
MAGMESVKAVHKTMALLEALAQQKEMGVTELAECAGMHKSTVYRFLNSLKELSYVRQNAVNEKYSLTLKLFELGPRAGPHGLGTSPSAHGAAGRADPRNGPPRRIG